MPGSWQEKLAGARAFAAYMMAHPWAKKLMFMGNEFCQVNEWNFEKALDWDLLREPSHYRQWTFFKALNTFFTARIRPCGRSILAGRASVGFQMTITPRA